MKIYFAKIEKDFNTDICGNMYRLGETNEAEYGEEWNGDVEGYIWNMMDGEDEHEIKAGIACNLDMGALTDAKNIYTLYVNGEPSELWFAAE